MEKIPLYILAGGQGSPCSPDKARAIRGDEPLILRIANRLSPVAASVTVVADREDQYDDLGLRTLADVKPGLGPLGGLLTALGDAGEGWILLAACDLAEVRPEWVERLSSQLDGAAQAAAFKNDRWQGALGLYHTHLCGAILRHVQTGRRALRDLLDRCDAVAVTPPKDWPAR